MMRKLLLILTLTALPGVAQVYLRKRTRSGR